MKIVALTLYLTLTLTIALTGCGDVGADSRDELASACNQATNMTEALCDCIAGLATDELSDDGVAFLAAAMRNDDDATERLRARMSPQDLLGASMFMVSGTQRCASGEAS